MRRDRNEAGDTWESDDTGRESGTEESGQQSAGTADPGAAPASGDADEAGAPEGQSEGEPEGGAGALKRQLEELRDRHLRLVAEFDNYRKRTERERSESWVKAQGQLVEKLLEAVDDLERVADFTEESTSVTALLEGVQMVERKLLRALETAGLERVEAHGAPFNPQEHEALMTASTEHPHEDETVGEVFQKGYRFQGHLLRPARVQVRKHEG